ncbi:MAG: HNH endonuclease [Minisyncoccota bacterium]
MKLRIFASKGERCERCGYDTKEILNVHHKDRNHENNAMNNLELLCPNCHAEEHYLKNSWMNRTPQN